jgi:hypothetical protein
VRRRFVGTLHLPETEPERGGRRLSCEPRARQAARVLYCAKPEADIEMLFHELRHHTCVTRMLEGGVPLSVVGSILGRSPATTARMVERYGHIGLVARRKAVAGAGSKRAGGNAVLGRPSERSTSAHSPAGRTAVANFHCGVSALRRKRLRARFKTH